MPLLIASETLVAALLLAQQGPPVTDGLPPRAKASEYQASVAIPGSSSHTLAADYLGHSAPTGRGVLFAPNHIVLEVAVFGTEPIVVRHAHFQLQLTGKVAPKNPIATDPSSYVAATMREGSIHSANAPNLEATGSLGNAGVILGRRRPSTGSPDLDSTRQGRGPAPPVVGAPGHDRSGNSAEAPIDPVEALAKVELEPGERKMPARGLLFFPYAGKLKPLRTITLLYQPDPNKAAVALPLLP